MVGIPKVEKLLPTHFQEFDLKTNNLKPKAPKTISIEEKELQECKEFKALELNRKIFNNPNALMKADKSFHPYEFQEF